MPSLVVPKRHRLTTTRNRNAPGARLNTRLPRNARGVANGGGVDRLESGVMGETEPADPPRPWRTPRFS